MGGFRGFRLLAGPHEYSTTLIDRKGERQLDSTASCNLTHSSVHLSPFELYKLSARDFTCIRQIKAASLRERAVEKVVHAQARMTEHRKDSARRPYPSTVVAEIGLLPRLR